MALLRRRQSYYTRLRRLFPTFSIIFFVLILFFSLLCFLALSPNESDQLHRPPHHSTANIQHDDKDAIEVSSFRVPNGGGRHGRDLWSSRNSRFYYACSNASANFAKPETITQPNRYLMIATSGGLNQQRTGITDAVVAARILNATLVVPKLDQKSFWKDASNFSEIFDEDWFIKSLSQDVIILKNLPVLKKGGKTLGPRNMRVPRKCNERCYQNRVLPVLLKRHVVQLCKFDYRLANKLSTDLQKLRCRVNYHALRFTDPIRTMGKTLVNRMRMQGKHYVALHLRFEPDMLAFSGCDYGGGERERLELGAIRKRWKTLHMKNPEKARRQGRCPLTPEEVGLMLRALGYGSDVHIYVASGEVYRAEESLAPLKALFPNFHTKETIATKEELQPFATFSSRMAALDFMVCDESDVFVTNNNGNMARILAGRRRYFGHKPTIRPSARKLQRLFMNKGNMTWEEFAMRARRYQKGFMGEPMESRPGRGEFHENPSACICEDSEAKAKKESVHRKFGRKGGDTEREEIEDVADDVDSETELDLADADEEDLEEIQDQVADPTTDYDTTTNEEPDNTTNEEPNTTTNEEPELEEMLSD